MLKLSLPLLLGLAVIIFSLSFYFLNSPWLAFATLPPTAQARLVIEPDSPVLALLNIDLQSSDWRVANRGQYLVAYKSDQPIQLASFTQSLKNLAQLVSRYQTIQPKHAIIDLEQQIILFTQDKTGPTPDADIALNLSGNYLATLPDQLTASINQQLLDRLNINLTKPDIVAELETYQNFTFIVQSDQALLAVAEPDRQQFAALATRLVQAEDQAQNPVSSKFALPDGTIARELVPGQPRPVFSELRDHCQDPIPTRSTLWLCQLGQKTVLATSRSAVEYLPALLPPHLIHFQNLTVWGDGVNWHIVTK